MGNIIKQSASSNKYPNKKWGQWRKSKVVQPRGESERI